MSLAFAGGYFTTEPPGNPYHGSEIYYTRKWFSKSGPWRFYQQHYLRPYKCKILSSTLELLNQRQELALSLCFKNSSRGLGCTIMFEDHWRRYVGGGMSEKAMAPHSSTLAWKIPWAEEPGRLQSMGHKESDTTERLHFHFSLSCIGEGNGNPLQCSCLENLRDSGAWWAAVSGVSQSRTRLKRLSSSSRRRYVLWITLCLTLSWGNLFSHWFAKPPFSIT